MFGNRYSPEDSGHRKLAQRGPTTISYGPDCADESGPMRVFAWKECHDRFSPADEHDVAALCFATAQVRYLTNTLILRASLRAILHMMCLSGTSSAISLTGENWPRSKSTYLFVRRALNAPRRTSGLSRPFGRRLLKANWPPNIGTRRTTTVARSVLRPPYDPKLFSPTAMANKPHMAA